MNETSEGTIDADEGPYQIRLVQEQGSPEPGTYIYSSEFGSLDDAKSYGESELRVSRWVHAAIAPVAWWKKVERHPDRKDSLGSVVGDSCERWPIEAVSPGRIGIWQGWEHQRTGTVGDVFPGVAEWPPAWNPLGAVFDDEDEAAELAARMGAEDLRLFATDCVARVVGVQEVALLSDSARQIVKAKRGVIAGTLGKESLEEIRVIVEDEFAELEERDSFDKENDDPEGDLWDGRWNARVVPWASFKAAEYATQAAVMLATVNRDGEAVILAARAAGWAGIARTAGTSPGSRWESEERKWQAGRAHQYTSRPGGKTPAPLSPDDGSIPVAIGCRVRMKEYSDGVMVPVVDEAPSPMAVKPGVSTAL